MLENLSLDKIPSKLALVAAGTLIAACSGSPATKPETAQTANQTTKTIEDTCGIDASKNHYQLGFEAGETLAILNTKRADIGGKIDTLCQPIQTKDYEIQKANYIKKCNTDYPDKKAAKERKECLDSRIADADRSAKKQCQERMQAEWLLTQTGQMCGYNTEQNYAPPLSFGYVDYYKEKRHATFVNAYQTQCREAQVAFAADFLEDMGSHTPTVRFVDSEIAAKLEKKYNCLKQRPDVSDKENNAANTGWKNGQEIGRYTGAIEVLKERFKEEGKVDPAALEFKCKDTDDAVKILAGMSSACPEYRWSNLIRSSSTGPIDLNEISKKDPKAKGKFYGVEQAACFYSNVLTCMQDPTTQNNVTAGKVEKRIPDYGYEDEKKATAALVPEFQKTFKIPVTFNAMPEASLNYKAELVHDSAELAAALRTLWEELSVYPLPQPSTGKSILEKAGIKNISLIKVTDKNTFDPSGVVRHNSGFIIDINNPLWPLSLHYQLSMQLNEKADQGAREAKTTRANTTIWTSFNKKAGKTYSQPSVQMAAKGYTGFDSTTNGFTSTIAKEGALQDEASLAAAIFGGKMPELITRIKGGDKALEVDVEVLLGLEIDPAAGKFIGPLNAKKLGQLGFYNGIDYYGHWAKPNPTAPSLVTVDFTNSLASGKRPTLPLPKGTEKKAAITDISIQEKP